MGHYYIFENNQVREVEYSQWLEWYRQSDHIIERSEIAGAVVITSFHGLNRQFNPQLPPLIFRTLIVGGEYDGYREGYPTLSDALAGHRRIVSKIGPADVLDAEFIGYTQTSTDRSSRETD